MTTWIDLLECCHARKVAPEVVVFSKKFGDDRSVTTRRSILKILHKQHGLTVRDLSGICDLTNRAIRGIVNKRP